MAVVVEVEGEVVVLAGSVTKEAESQSASLSLGMYHHKKECSRHPVIQCTHRAGCSECLQKVKQVEPHPASGARGPQLAGGESRTAPS